MAKQVLDFEKPILELEQKMEEMRKYADNPDSCNRASSPISRAGRRCSWHAIRIGRIRLTTSR
jgi:hypothetical protein